MTGTIIQAFALFVSVTTSSWPASGSLTADSFKRAEKSLVGNFPFNQGQHGDHQGDHHGDHHRDHHEDRLSRQQEGEEQHEPVDIRDVASAGQRCVEKVMMVEETKYDDAIECHHSYDKRCHKTYTTDYTPQQVEDCDENFVKECHIEYKSVAFNESVEICNERPVRDCKQEGPVVCETVYESECQTTYRIHEVEEDTPKCEIQYMEKCRDVSQGYSTKQECDKWPQQVCQLEKNTVKRYTPDTQCEKKPREVCGPGPCPIVAGPKECRQEQKTVVQEVPEETCSLRARPYCEFETKLVPVLKPVENCVEVPKEVCVRMRKNPRKVKRPVIKKWCYTPTGEEEGSVAGATTDDDVDNDSVTADADVTDDAPETVTKFPEEIENSDVGTTEPFPPGPVGRIRRKNRLNNRRQY